MQTTYDVRVYKMQTMHCQGNQRSYGVRWKVAGKPFRETFRNSTQADGFRSDLLAASRKGELFDRATGLPASWHRVDLDRNWFEFACEYCDARWPDSAAHSRRSRAEALTKIAIALLGMSGRQNTRSLRAALRNVAFTTVARTAVDDPEVALLLR